MIVELVGFIMAFVYKGKLKDVYETTLLKALEDGVKNNKTELLIAFQQLEKSLECCGVLNVTDYGNISRSRLSEQCKLTKPPIGCAEKIINLLNSNLPIIGGTLGGVLAVELFGLIASIALAVALKHAPDGDYSSNPGQVLSSIVPGRRRW